MLRTGPAPVCGRPGCGTAGALVAHAARRRDGARRCFATESSPRVVTVASGISVMGFAPSAFCTVPTDNGTRIHRGDGYGREQDDLADGRAGLERCVRGGRLCQRVRRDQWPPLAVGHPLERPTGQSRDASRQREHPRPQSPRHRQAPGEEVRRLELSGSSRRVAEHHHPAPRGQQLQGGPADRAPHAVVHNGHATLAELIAHSLGPVGRVVVDRDVGLQLGEPVQFGLAACGRDHGRADCLRRLHEQPAEAAGSRRDQHDVVGSDRLGLEDAQRRPPGADRGDGRRRIDMVGHLEEIRDRRGRLGRVTAGDHPEVGHDPPVAPGLVDAGAERIDHARDLAAGNGGQLGRRHRTRLPLPKRGVEQVYAGCLDRDPDFAGSGLEVRQLVEDQVGCGSELVKPDCVHASQCRT